ncbi:hypothetical protein Tco_1391430 [Tanacetum coccineum]
MSAKVVYGAILPQHLTNQAILESEAYMTYHAYATGEKTPKPKSTKKKANFESSPKTKLTQAFKGKKSRRRKKGGITFQAALDNPSRESHQLYLTEQSEVALTEGRTKKASNKKTAQNKLTSSHARARCRLRSRNSSFLPGVPDVPTYKSDDEQISWKSSKEEDDDEVNVSKYNDDDADNDDDVDKDDEDDDHDNQDDEIPDDANQDDDDEEDEMDEEATHEEDEANELYRDVNINLEGRDTQSFCVSSGFVSNMLNPNPDTVPTPATVPSSSLQDLPNFGSLFGFDHRLKTLETDFSEFKQTNQIAEAVSFIPDIVDAYLANKIHEAVKTAVQLQSERLRDEAQAKNADFLNKLDYNIKKIIKDQVKEQVKAQVSKILPKIKKTVNEQLEAEVMTRSSTESKTYLTLDANLSELELKKILVDKMESNKSIHRSDEQKNLYKALVWRYYFVGSMIIHTNLNNDV